MPNYRVAYAFEHADSDTRPEGEKYGYGVIVVNTDKTPESPEELKEIARFIGTRPDGDSGPGYKAVGIVSIVPTELGLDADRREVLEAGLVDMREAAEAQTISGEVLDD